MTRADSALHQALGRLANLVDERDADEVAELIRRLRDRRLRVVVVGEAKRGKSTLINALVGRPLLPTGVLPLTAVVTTVQYGDPEHVDVAYVDGRCENAPIDTLRQLVTEDANPDNQRGVQRVVVTTPTPLLGSGIELVDTPGTGSVFEHNTTEAAGALARMDVALFVVAADPPISASERQWLRQVREQAVRVICVLNKVDYLSRADLDQAIEFTRAIVGEEVGKPVEVWPVSARNALAAEGDAEAADAQWREFHHMLTAYLRKTAETDLAASVTTRAARLAGAVVEEATATIATLQLSAEDLDQRMRTFTQQLNAVQRSRFESAALARATIDRLVAETDRQAAELPTATTPVLLDDVIAALDASAGSLRELEQQAVDRAAALIRDRVDEWRAAHMAWLQSELTALDAQLRARIDEHVRTVRDTAATLFRLDLLRAEPAHALVPRSTFRYAFGPDVGQTEALATAVRTHLPGRLGRRAVTTHVRDRTVDLLHRQVGRARADFAARLREAERTLQRAHEERFHAGAGRIVEAIQRAAVYREDRSAGHRQLAEQARERRDVAAALRAELDRLLAGGQVGPVVAPPGAVRHDEGTGDGARL